MRINANVQRATNFGQALMCNLSMPAAPAPPLPWLESDSPFPPVHNAWGADSAAPGLLAVGADLSVERLVNAYSQGIFPWYSENQPILWWSPSPRMVLQTAHFKLQRSLRKSWQHHLQHSALELSFDRAFDQVITHCAQAPRRQQAGTWIVPDMVRAYLRLHRAGFAHSVEVWLQGQLVAGLYFVCLGKAVFGESMFTQVNDGSKLALAALVQVCQRHGIGMIDCQQNTAHLASLGAAEISREDFIHHIVQHQSKPSPDWAHETVACPSLPALSSPT